MYAGRGIVEAKERYIFLGRIQPDLVEVGGIDPGYQLSASGEHTAGVHSRAALFPAVRI